MLDRINRAWHFERLEINNPGSQGAHSRTLVAIISSPPAFLALDFLAIIV